MRRYPISPPAEAKIPFHFGRTEPEGPTFDPDADDGRCKASSWCYGNPSLPRDRKRITYEHLYGPGGYNRCIFTTEHHLRHQDEWGHVFLTQPEFKVLRHQNLVPPESATRMAKTGRQ